MGLDSQPTKSHGPENHRGDGSTKVSSDDGPVPNTPANTPLAVDDAGRRVNLDWGRLDLTTLMPQDSPFRVLILPKVEAVSISAYGGKSHPDNWVEVQVGAPPEESHLTRLFALAATEEHVGCCVTHYDTRFIMYFNVEHTHDHLVLCNYSPHVIYATPLYDRKTEKVENWSPIELTLGEWIISSNDEPLIEVKVLERKHWPISPSLSTKRSAEDTKVLPKKTRLSPHLGGVWEETLEAQSSTNDLLTLRRGEKVHIGAVESISYQLKQLAIISDHQFTRVCRAEHSNVPGRVVAIKIIKTANAGEDATVRAAEAWMHETDIRSSFGNHFAVAEYIGSDARFHSIYTEYIDAKPLMDYRDSDCRFNGNTVRAWRILGDMAAGLSFIHANNIVHGNIKLLNILFSPVRGAVLVDFSISFREGSPLRSCGAPWYLPPEFVTIVSSRGKPSDMWALGVVMMWVLGHIPIPEGTRHWNASDLHPGGPPQECNMKARVRMSEWINAILEAKPIADEQVDEIQEIVNGLVERNQNNRTDAATLEEQIFASNIRQSTDSSLQVID
ncbi:kinase-like domain-containing protein [Xylaria telfairii]|nr:kinase-like domain-containing protein [Xylaria telfairii]